YLPRGIGTAALFGIERIPIAIGRNAQKDYSG
ncbi:MAG: hypothetical protein ACI857_001883, partial [Arenicella sp.]